MADGPVDAASGARRYRRPFGAAPGIRLQQLAIGAWEVGGRLSEQHLREEPVRHTAYMLWIDAGQPAGRDIEFWLAAEKMIAEDASADAASQDSCPAGDPTAGTDIIGS